MRALFTSDWHLDAMTLGRSRREEIVAAVQETVDVAIREKLDAYFFLGDLSDPDDGGAVIGSTEVLVRTAMQLAENGIPNIWISGNHDVLEDGRGFTTLSVLRGLNDYDEFRLVLAEEPRLFRVVSPEFAVVALPYTATSHAYDVEAFLKKTLPEVRDQRVIVIGHLSVPGVQPGEETTEMPRGREVLLPTEVFKEFPNVTVFNGHYHRQQTHDGVHIPGSLARLTFGEERHEPSYLIGEF